VTDEQMHAMENEKIRGQQIKGFLENETVQAVFKSLELSYFEAWKRATDPAEREQLHARASAFDDLRDSFKAVVASGERATHELTLTELSNPDLA
jgi:hypothetical protein